MRLLLALRRLSFDCVNSPRAFASVVAFSVLVVLLVLFALRGGGVVSSGVLLGRLVCRLVLGEELVRLVVSSRCNVVMLSCRLAFRLVWSSRPCVSWCSSRGGGVLLAMLSRRDVGRIVVCLIGIAIVVIIG